jgi:hypothetical protein
MRKERAQESECEQSCCDGTEVGNQCEDMKDMESEVKVVAAVDSRPVG